MTDQTSLEKAKNALLERKTILYPTDTIWGLGCDATNDDACKRLHALKNRPANKSFIVLVDSFNMLERYIPEFPEVCYELIDFATRPLTIIYPHARGLSPEVLAEDGSVGIRLTNDRTCLNLIRALKKPLVSTSANLSGEQAPTCYDDISQEIKEGVDAIVLDRLEEKMTRPSQIIKIGLDGSVQVIRH